MEDKEMEFLLDQMAKRYVDTDKVLRLFIEGKSVKIDDWNQFISSMLLTTVCNQTAIMAYILKREGHKGLPAEITVMREEVPQPPEKEEKEEGGDE